MSCEFTDLIKSDLYRYTGTTDILKMFHCFLIEPGARYMVVLRLTAWLRTQGLLLRPLYWMSKLLLGHYKYKFGVSIPYNTEIAPGFYIGHFGGIVVHSKVLIGRNCNINHDVTLGEAYGGKNPGIPKILNNVYLGPGCKVIGGVTVGNHVAIGANCVVTSSIPDKSVVVGVPGRIISDKGSGSYIVNMV